MEKRNESVDSFSCRTNSPNSNRKLHLPRLELTRFSGEVKDWLAFLSQFKRIDGYKDLVSEDKFQYLIQATVAVLEPDKLLIATPLQLTTMAKPYKLLKVDLGGKSY